jgi:hypothetical protein
MFCSQVSRGLLVSGLCVLTAIGSVRIWQFCAMAPVFAVTNSGGQCATC